MKQITHLYVTYAKFTIFIVGLLLSLPLLLPYLHAGYFPTHDGEWAVVRLTDMYRELKDLQFPARYSGNLNFGYGYPLFEFAYPLPYYLGFIIHVFHIPFVWSVKLLFALSIPGSFFAMYFLAQKVWKSSLAGVLSGILYLYLPYRLVDLFVRGSIGESLSFVIFPLILYFLVLVYETRKSTFSVFAGGMFAALIATHNIMAVEFAPVILLFISISLWTEKKIRLVLLQQYLLTFFVGLGLSCFFWLPALSEKHLIALSLIPIADRSLYFVQLSQLILPSWGYGTRDFSYQLGIPQLFVCLGFAIHFLLQKKIKLLITLQQIIVVLGVIVLIVYIILLFPISNAIWQVLPLFKEINYPWTLLAVSGFLIALLSGVLIASNRGKQILIICSCFAIIYCLQYTHPNQYVDRSDNFYLTNDATTTSSDEYMPIWVQQKPTQRVTQKFVSLSGKGEFKNEISTSKMFLVDVTSAVPVPLQVNTIYYPGWRVLIDGREVPISYTNQKGLISLSLPAGSHHIEGKLTETPLRLFADIVSSISLLFVIVVFGIYWKGRYAKK